MRTSAEPVTDLRGTMLGHGILIVRDATAFTVKQPEVHGWLRHPVEFETQRAIFCGKLYRLKGDLTEHKRRIHAAKQRIDALHHARGRAPVGIQRIVRLYLTAGLHVGENIRTAEGVNGLFRIAD